MFLSSSPSLVSMGRFRSQLLLVVLLSASVARIANAQGIVSSVGSVVSSLGAFHCPLSQFISENLHLMLYGYQKAFY